ncbi:hypothetical protein DY240_13060 [Jiangella rhizosphaerae]|uniref:Uncharacterized protein n=1 Tax=Jiangella rhizosphaerae TaxID=2293569 RepID=A0A418KR71_9ACTN|nr:hypothetical protein DY240_13060 [Jiangella rhizosphaerae]
MPGCASRPGVACADGPRPPRPPARRGRGLRRRRPRGDHRAQGARPPAAGRSTRRRPRGRRHRAARGRRPLPRLARRPSRLDGSGAR